MMISVLYIIIKQIQSLKESFNSFFTSKSWIY